MSLNVKRRNLTAGQTAVAAADAWDMPSPKVGSGKRAAALASMFGVGRGYVESARALVERDRAGADAVKNGDQSLKDAYDGGHRCTRNRRVRATWDSVAMTVAERLRRDLVVARRRGETFEAAWPVAVKHAITGQRADERTQWRAALADTREAWRAAWHREMATRAQVAVLAVAPDREPLAA